MVPRSCNEDLNALLYYYFQRRLGAEFDILGLLKGGGGSELRSNEFLDRSQGLRGEEMESEGEEKEWGEGNFQFNDDVFRLSKDCKFFIEKRRERK